MNLWQNKLVSALLALAVLLGTSPAGAVSEWRFPAAARIVAVADIHGAYGAFEKILQQTGVIDESLEWSGGGTHLVIVGDVLDRGADSRQAMDLIMRLESESVAGGGRVHMVLGNHELMNLTGDLRYVAPGEYAAFSADEPADVREAAWTRFLARVDPNEDEAVATAEFDRQFPPGFFGHRAAFASDGVYGAWLLERPLLVQIGDTAFVHGGLSDTVVEIGAEGVNNELLRVVADYVDAMEALSAGGVLGAADNFYDQPAVIDQFAERVALGEAIWPDGAEAAAERLQTLNRDVVFGSAGPAWYRGTVGCSPLVEHDRLLAALEKLGVERVVVGHTPTPNARVLSRLAGTVMRIDTDNT